jgi:hypothetical protein
MQEWNGDDRRSNIEMDWHLHKETILNQLRDLKTATKNTDDKVMEMQIGFAVLNTKLMTASALSSFIVATVISIVATIINV